MDYTAVNAKISAMNGGLLKYSDYDMLSHLGTVGEVALRLQEYRGYRKVFENLRESMLHRGHIENRLALALMDDFWSICFFVDDNNLRHYLNAFFMKREIQAIKLILAMICGEGRRPYSCDDLIGLVGEKASVDIKSLYSASNVREFLQILSDAPIYKRSVTALPEGAGLFQIEIKLDLLYYINLWKTQNYRLDKRDRKIMNHIVGTEIDLRNIMWAYRFNKHYHMNSSMVYSCLIPIKYRLQADDVHRIVEIGEGIEQEALNAILPKVYKSVFVEETTLEYDFHNAMNGTLRKERRENKKSIAVLISYLYAKELEINNITSLIEGVRYNLSPNKIMKYLKLWDETGAGRQ